MNLVNTLRRKIIDAHCVIFGMFGIFIANKMQAWSNLETANESEMRLVHSSNAHPIFNELVT
jgi:hypothetical protein